ncbi:hypothetical protein [Stackebrandtia soli]|uniref:hypothetical protein n=1 Tax=Stackebrandtia soli TaxID=1892856 RepID=UPI0039E9BE23
MFIDKTQVRGVGGKISVIGDDAESYLNRVSSQMQGSLQGNEGFATVATLREVVSRLSQHTSRLAETSRTVGSNVVTAADNHSETDRAQANNFQSIDLSEVF